MSAQPESCFKTQDLELSFFMKKKGEDGEVLDVKNIQKDTQENLENLMEKMGIFEEESPEEAPGTKTP